MNFYEHRHLYGRYHSTGSFHHLTTGESTEKQHHRRGKPSDTNPEEGQYANKVPQSRNKNDYNGKMFNLLQEQISNHPFRPNNLPRKKNRNKYLELLVKYILAGHVHTYKTWLCNEAIEHRFFFLVLNVIPALRVPCVLGFP